MSGLPLALGPPARQSRPAVPPEEIGSRGGHLRADEADSSSLPGGRPMPDLLPVRRPVQPVLPYRPRARAPTAALRPVRSPPMRAVPAGGQHRAEPSVPSDVAVASGAARPPADLRRPAAVETVPAGRVRAVQSVSAAAPLRPAVLRPLAARAAEGSNADDQEAGHIRRTEKVSSSATGSRLHVQHHRNEKGKRPHHHILQLFR